MNPSELDDLLHGPSIHPRSNHPAGSTRSGGKYRNDPNLVPPPRAALPNQRMAAQADVDRLTTELNTLRTEMNQRPKKGTGGSGKIRDFTGSPHDDFEVFLDRYLMVAEAEDWTDTQRLKKLPIFFSGIAEQKWNSVPRAEKARWTWAAAVNGVLPAGHILTNLRSLFEDTGERARHATLLWERTQKVGEGVATYALELGALYRRSYPDSQADCAQFRDQFVAGLQPKLRTLIRQANPTSYKAAYDTATLYENIQQSTSKPSAPVFAAHSGSSGSEGEEEFVGAFGRDSQYRPRQGQSSRSRGPPPSSSYSSSRQNRPPPPASSEGGCYQCGSKTHYKRDCPEKPTSSRPYQHQSSAPTPYSSDRPAGLSDRDWRLLEDARERDRRKGSGNQDRQFFRSNRVNATGEESGRDSPPPLPSPHRHPPRLPRHPLPSPPCFSFSPG